MAKSFAFAVLALSCGVLAGPIEAAAQTAPGAPGTNQVIPEKDPSLQTHGGSAGSGATTTEGRSSNLSDKLNRSNGVIAPPSGVDPAIRKPAPTPDPNSTPVITPPSASGGNVQAK